MKKINNKVLIIALALLAVVFLITKFYRSTDNNLDTDQFSIDTASITEIKLRPQRDTLRELKLVRDKNTWRAERDNVRSPVQPYSIRNLLEAVASLKPERIATRKKEKWNQYNVDDSAASEAVFFQGQEELLRLKIGKETGGVTYARVNGEDEVYALQGYLKDPFDKKFNEWRNPAFLRLDKEHISKIRFQYPADSGFVLEKKPGKWTIHDQPADSAKVEKYLNKLRSTDHDVFADTFTPDKNPDITITVSYDTKTETVIKGWKISFFQWVLNSNQRSDTYFLYQGGASSVDELLIGKKKLLK